MNTTITVREHARLTTAEVSASEMLAQISQPAFDWLLSESARLHSATGGARLIWLEGRRDLRLDNYVGVLESPCGTRIEILPKIVERGDSVDYARALLQRMLTLCFNLKPRQSSPTEVCTFNVPLTEWVARQFLLGVERLVKRGLRFDYHPVHESLRYLRGRLQLQHQTRQAPGRDHYFHVMHDLFDADRAENRLIRLALELVRKQTREPTNLRLAHELTHYLHEIPTSRNIAEDLKRWRNDRLMTHYEPLRDWTSLILHRQMPLTVAGAQRGHSLLFPMEKVFEQYVGIGLRKWIPPEASLLLQAARHHLTTHCDQPRFQLRPDFLIEHNGQSVVADAKWKIIDGTLNNGSQNYGLSQRDFYQMYAYGQKYLHGSGVLYLFYPKTSGLSSALQPFHFSETLLLQVVPIDLEKGTPIIDFLATASQCESA